MTATGRLWRNLLVIRRLSMTHSMLRSIMEVMYRNVRNVGTGMGKTGSDDADREEVCGLGTPMCNDLGLLLGEFGSTLSELDVHNCLLCRIWHCQPESMSTARTRCFRNQVAHSRVSALAWTLAPSVPMWLLRLLDKVRGGPSNA